MGKCLSGKPHRNIPAGDGEIPGTGLRLLAVMIARRLLREKDGRRRGPGGAGRQSEGAPDGKRGSPPAGGDGVK